MRKLAIFVLIMGVLPYCWSAVYAQTFSTYEQKRYDLALETTRALIETDASLALTIGLAAERYRSGLPDEMKDDKYVELDFSESIIQALGMGVSFMGIDSWQDYYMKKSIQEIYQEWEHKKMVLDKTRTKDDIRKEQLRKNPPTPTKGTLADLRMRIKNDFEKWAKKGTYEKTAAQEKRLNEKGIMVFDSICMLHCQNIIYASEYADLNIDNYNADGEYYVFHYTYGDQEFGLKTLDGKLYIPVEYASADTRGKISFTITRIQIMDSFVLPLEMNNTSTFIINNQKITRNSSLIFDEISDATELQLCFRDIDFSGATISDSLFNHCFRIDDYTAMKKSKTDSLKKLYKDIVKRFDKIVADHDKIIRYAEGVGWSTYDIGTVESYFKKDADSHVYNSIRITIEEYSDIRNEKSIGVAIDVNTANWESVLTKWKKSLDLAEATMKESTQNAFNNYINHKYDRLLDYPRGVIKKIACDDGIIEFTAKYDQKYNYLGNRKTIQGEFNKKDLTASPLGDKIIYTGYYEVIQSSDNTMCLIRNHGDVYLIVGEEAFKLSESAQNSLLEYVDF